MNPHSAWLTANAAAIDGAIARSDGMQAKLFRFERAVCEEWVASGRQVFRPSADLCKDLSSVPLDGVRWEDVAVPYPTFWLDLRGLGWRLPYNNGDPGLAPITGGYAHCERGGGDLVLLLWGDPRKHGAHPEGCNCHGTSTWATARMNGGTDAEEAVMRAIREPQDIEDREVLQRAFRLTIGLCLFLRGDDADTSVERGGKADLRAKIRSATSNKKRARLRRRLLRTGDCTVTTVTRRNGGGRSSGGSSHTAAGRHWVRRHWHRYWVGKAGSRRAEYRLVGPFLRGVGPARGRIYKLDKQARHFR